LHDRDTEGLQRPLVERATPGEVAYWQLHVIEQHGPPWDGLSIPREAEARSHGELSSRLKPMAKGSAQISGGANPAEGASYKTRPLDASTWGAFAELVERNNGVYGGCWCIAHHREYQRGVSDPRTLKEELVRSGRARAALVFDEHALAQGWCQYGSPDELALKHEREYAKNAPPRARWRIACIFVDKGHRGRGVARAALEGALAQIADAGGGRVEAISEVSAGREAHSRFLFSATVELFEHYGFARERQVGKHAWIVSREIGRA
jgi:GNAT superfamily N-acetyltransferase